MTKDFKSGIFVFQKKNKGLYTQSTRKSVEQKPQGTKCPLIQHFQIQRTGQFSESQRSEDRIIAELMQIRNHAWLIAGARKIKGTAPSHCQSWHTFEKWQIPRERAWGLGAWTAHIRILQRWSKVWRPYQFTEALDRVLLEEHSLLSFSVAWTFISRLSEEFKKQFVQQQSKQVFFFLLVFVWRGKHPRVRMRLL